MIEIPLTQGLVATVDDDCAHLLERKWYADKKAKGTVYAMRSGWDPVTKKRFPIYMHREIMGAAGREQKVDHIDHDTLNNIRANLRVVTHSQNLRNLLGATSKSRTGILGVGWHKQIGKWRAYIGDNAKYVHLGLFDTIEEATAARKAAEIKFGYGHSGFLMVSDQGE